MDPEGCHKYLILPLRQTKEPHLHLQIQVNKKKPPEPFLSVIVHKSIIEFDDLFQ